MLDFLMISTKSTKRGLIEIYPKFIIKKSSDLMIRGGDFYAIWVEDRGLWSTEEQDALDLIDKELYKYYEENKHKYDCTVRVLYMWDSESGMIDQWHKYCQKQMRDSFRMLDENLIFANHDVKKDDYASRKLSYSLEKGDIKAWNKLISTLYSPEERHKIEWAIGSIVTGESKHIQKFLVLYGEGGTGKSTILNIIQQLFDGYYSVFDAKALGSSNNSFALEAFKKNPLVAIQHDGDLSRIEDNTRLNSLVSHELMTVNEKFKSTYESRFKCFLFIGTNKPVKITDAKSGLIRRLIDVTPTGNKLERFEYDTVMKQIKFELGAIAYHCREVFLENPGYYNDYIPVNMLGATNDFYNFVMDSYLIFKDQDSTSLKAAWEMYKTYCNDAKINYPYSQRVFKEELKNYFREYKERHILEDGSRIRNFYNGFIVEKFEDKKPTKTDQKSWIRLEENIGSIFDDMCKDYPAQYASVKETPVSKWENVNTILSDIDTTQTHYVRILDKNHIVIDFDLKDENGNKSLEKNIEEATKWPSTYAELSKSGYGIHLHYIYTGDVSRLSRIYDKDIEIKIFTGNAALRRKLSKCNKLPIATISSGLPLKGEDKMINFKGVENEKHIRSLIRKNLNKEIHPATKPSIDFIHKILEDAYNSGMRYDVSDMRSSILAFAASSTNQSVYCVKLVSKMKFKSDEPSQPTDYSDSEFPINAFDVRKDDLVFYDIEVFPNLFIVNWKKQGKDRKIVRMINPKPSDIEGILRFKLVGFNCRRYDNHILYAAFMGYNNEQLFRLSQKIINGEPNCFFGEAYNISYTDVYDFLSAGNKKSLKKWEIELGIHHKELGIPWDQPVPEELWVEVAEYCDNDVIATEAVFEHCSADWIARQILADLAGMTVNDTTNTLTAKIIFGDNRKPQDQFNYRDLSEPVKNVPKGVIDFLKETKPYMVERPFNSESILPYFPGYKFENGKSTYREEEVGEGGYVHAFPGMYGDVALLDVASMHPTSVICEVLFGVEFTRRFYEIVYGRVSIKHEAWDEVNKILDGKLTPYIQKVISGELTSDNLADALKTAINSVYGLTAAGFENAFRDLRNIDNIVAKRGALFMIDLKYAVQTLGYDVVHIKTDSIKIANASLDIINFVMEFGKKYGYEFEHEATYDKMCLVNDAVYIAKYATAEKCEKLYGYSPKKNKKKPGQLTATGAQFAVPYTFKSLFSKEPIEFDDMCETRSVTTAMYLDFNEGLPDVTMFEKVKELRGKSSDKLTKGEKNLLEQYSYLSEDDLNSKINEGHNYRFVGRVGRFCPVKEGCGGGDLLREKTENIIR